MKFPFQNQTMRAVVQRGIRHYPVEDVPIPEPGPGEALIRVEAAGICAGDRVTYQGLAPWGIDIGVIPGHENVGIVVALGDGAGEAMGIALGDRVTAEVQIPCGTCPYCRKGYFNLCEDYSGFLEGGMAQYMLLRRGTLVHKVPKNIDRLCAAMIEPLSCGAYAVERAAVEMKDTVVVSGMGTIGLAALQFAKLRNPLRIIALGTNEFNMGLAEEYGADAVLNAKDPDVAEQIRTLTDSLGCDVFIECAGAPASAETGIAALRKRGRMMIYGVYTANASVDLNEIGQNKELTITGGHLSPGMMPYVIDCLARGRIHPEKIATDVFPLEEAEAAMNVRAVNPHSIKAILVP